MKGAAYSAAAAIGTLFFLAQAWNDAGIIYAAQQPSDFSAGMVEAMGLPDDSDIPENLEIDEDLDFDFPDGTNLQDTSSEILELSDLQATHDLEYGGFRYDLPNGTWFSLNVPAGAISTRYVSLHLSDELYTFHVERDGTLLDPTENLIFSENGMYNLTLHTGKLEENEAPVFYELSLDFQICDSATNELSEIEVPAGFHVTELSRNGSQKEIPESTIVLEEDGDWDMTFVSDADSAAVYRLAFELDREAPKLQFSRPIDQGPVRPPLKITALEDDCEILIQDGSELVPLQDGILTYGGIYRVIARDSKGNERNYSVQIRYSLFHFSIKMIIIFVLLAAGLIGYLFYLRRHIQIL